MLFGNESDNNYEQKYCYCQYGESGIMISCNKCNKWLHDECLGLTETQIENIDIFYCNECLNSNTNLSIVYKNAPLSATNVTTDIHCYCNGSEYGTMFECSKCRGWFHDDCLNFTDTEKDSLLIFFCETCIEKYSELNILFKEEVDYTLEHTKPLFKSYSLLSIHNLYPYYTLLELFKILKFRQPYCLYEIMKPGTILSKCKGLTIRIPETKVTIQQKTFTYKSITLWNKHYKSLIKPFAVPLHKDFKLKYDNTSTINTLHYDFTTKVSTFKAQLKELLINKQHYDSTTDWNINCFLS